MRSPGSSFGSILNILTVLTGMPSRSANESGCLVQVLILSERESWLFDLDEHRALIDAEAHPLQVGCVRIEIIFCCGYQPRAAHWHP